ncbi:MAG: hypothetical protein NC040_09385 [Muribaculaceae bacterium]|nr:hypothetical protein [Alistipes senegalensis]MCM1474261.1 hypothetical protein [Muribaculaceae bacterium]
MADDKLEIKTAIDTDGVDDGMSDIKILSRKVWTHSIIVFRGVFLQFPDLEVPC